MTTELDKTFAPAAIEEDDNVAGTKTQGARRMARRRFGQVDAGAGNERRRAEEAGSSHAAIIGTS